MKKTYERKINGELKKRLLESRRFIQVMMGPRQVGKTTACLQVVDAIDIPSHYASADIPSLQSQTWLEQQWEIARLKTRDHKEALLVLDEVQKVRNWPTIVKRLWDEDSAKEVSLKVVLLGSSPLLMQAGLTESLAGRFEVIYATHWSYKECREYFGWDADKYIYFGGYPGAATLIEDRERWVRYIQESLIETTISRDILLMTRVDKPALLRQLFYLGCQYSSQILSYQKMLGQLQDAGNTTTLAHYLNLLSAAGMLRGLEKYSEKALRQRASSPKLQVFNTALITAQSHTSFELAKANREFWGRLVESSIGAHLANLSFERKIDLYYWRERNREVDFVIRSGNKLIAIEVKSGRSKGSLLGMENFKKRFFPGRILLIGDAGIPVNEFLEMDLTGLGIDGS